MKKSELRGETRLRTSLKAELSSGGHWFSCRILDMSDTGFSIICNKQLAPGQVLDFRCELYPGKFLDCKIEIKHVDDTCAGTKIVEISKKGASLCQLFLQEKYFDRQNKHENYEGR